MRARATCPEPQCPNLQPCAAHRRDAFRAGARKRGYDARWERLREEHLNKEPLCRACAHLGRVTAATDVDHIIPFHGLNDPLRLDDRNLQSLCHSHHSIKTHEDKRLGLTRATMSSRGDAPPYQIKSLGPPAARTAGAAAVSLYGSGNVLNAGHPSQSATPTSIDALQSTTPHAQERFSEATACAREC